ncbi:MAG: hypothetical protein KA604_00120 [Candidatus Saccharimonas sp.]|jgi:hypothetical protein|nr:hypothetical protein [Candidatus Saccharimonas sp.]
METTTGIESVTLSDIMNLATWDRSRTTVELRSFINDRDEALDVEDFDF